MPSLGDMYVQVQGDWSRFHREVAAEVAALAKVDFQVRPTMDTGVFRTQMRLFRLQFLRDQSFKVEPRLVGGNVGVGLFNDRTFRVEPVLDTKVFRQQMATFRLQFLRDHRFTITADMDDAVARARMAALAAQAAALGAMSPTIRINTATSGAALGGLSNHIQRIISLIAILGSAAVPVAAALVGGFFAVAGAAAAAGAGVGVLALALSGVFGAVKALSAARDAAAKTNALSVRQDNQMAGAADTLRSALATLANTRASAAASAVSAARAISDAERTLGNAQRSALAAQQDLTRARVEARQAMEDLSSSVKNNALSIRQANLDLAAAKIELDRVLADPTATDAQRAQAQLNYDRAVQQIDDLTTRQARLTAEQAASNRAGVEGSDQVRSAVERLAEAQRGVADAERGVADARRASAEQQRQSAFAIEQALQAVTAAQRGLATAAVTTASTAGAAMDEFSRKMAGLSNEGRQFVLFVFSLRQEALQLRRVAEAGFLPGFQSGIQRLLPFMPQLISFVDRVAEGLGDIADRSFAALVGSSWRPFFSYLDGTAVPTLREMSATFGDIILGLANMVLAFAPVQRQVGGGFREMAADFAEWSATLRTNRDFQVFLDYVTTRGPAVVTTIKDLVSAIMRIAIAAAPVGDVVLATLQALSAVIAGIPTPLLTTFVLAFAGLRIAALIGPMLVGVGTALATMGRHLLVGTTSMVAFRASMSALVAAMGGPVTVAITAAVVVLGLLVARSAKVKAEIDALKTSMISYARGLEGGFTPESERATAAMLAQDNKMRSLLTLMGELGISQQTLVGTLRGEQDARKELVAVIDSEIAAQQAILDVRGEQQRSLTLEQRGAAKRIEDLKRQRGAIVEVSVEQAISNELVEKAAAAALVLAHNSGMLSTVQRALADAQRVLADSASTAEEKTDALRVATRALHEAAIIQIDAEERYARALLGVTEALDVNGNSFGLNTIEALNNRDALEEVLRASVDMYDADIQAGIGLDIATEKHKKRIQALIDEALKTGANEQEVRDLITAYDAVPGEVNTDVQTKGLEEVFKDLVNLAVAQRALQEGISPADAWAKYGGLYTTAHMRPLAERALAGGGLVTGPGGPTDDMVPAALYRGGRAVAPIRLSDREFVQRAAAVDFYGVSAMTAINEMKVPRAALAMAQGGVVETWPFPMDVTKTLRPDITWVIATNLGPTGAGPGFSSWPSSPGAQRGDSGVWRSIVNLIRSTGPLSGSFGNAYRPGDPLWHGSGRAVDWMGFNQDALSQFFMARRGQVLELIHRTNTRNYAVARGQDRGSFGNTLMEQHRNHIHIAMKEGGALNSGMLARVMDSGGIVRPGEIGMNAGSRNEMWVPEGMRISLTQESVDRLGDRIARSIARELVGASMVALHAGRARSSASRG